MIKHTVQNDPHATPVQLFDQTDKELIRCFQVRLVRHACDIPGCIFILRLPVFHQLTIIFDDLSKMRIDIIIVLNIVFVIRWRYKKRVEIDDLHTELLKIIELIQHALQIAAVKFPDAHAHGRQLIPVLHSCRPIPDIKVFAVLHIVCQITIKKAVGKYLIHDRALRPLRSRKARNDTKRTALLQVT